MRKYIIIALILGLIYPTWIFAAAPRSVDDLPVFPAAEGFGTGTVGAYGAANNPVICVVDSLAVSGASSTLTEEAYNGTNVLVGGLKQCLESTDLQIEQGTTADLDGNGNANTLTGTDNFGRLVIFAISGTIDFGSEAYLKISTPYVSILGATAPSPGITITGTSLRITAPHVYVSHLKIRPGAHKSYPNADNIDGIVVDSDNRIMSHVVIDHCSVSWGVDENVNFNKSTYALGESTVSNCIISEGLDESEHSKWKEPPYEPRSMGFIDQTGVSELTLLGNAFLSNRQRTPTLKGDSPQVVNNVTYNARSRPIKIAGQTGVQEASVRNNVTVNGPESDATNSDYFLWLDSSMAAEDNIYTDGNISAECSATYAAACSPESDGIDNDGHVDSISVGEPAAVSTSGLTVRTALNLIDSTSDDYIFKSAGARPSNRDAIDQNVIDDFEADLILAQASQAVTNGAYVDVEGSYPTGSDTFDFTTGTYAIPSSPHDGGTASTYTNLETWTHYFIGSGKWTVEGEVPIDTQFDNTNITFMWDCEALDFTATSGAANYSAGDKVGTASGAEISDTAEKHGTYGILANAGQEDIQFDSASIIDLDADGTVAMWINFGTWTDNAEIWEVGADADNRAFGYMDGTDEVGFKWRQGASTEVNIFTSTNLSGWHYVEFRFDEDNNTMSIDVDNVQEAVSTDAMTAITETYLHFGEQSGYTGFAYFIDDIKIADTDTENFYDVRDEIVYSDAENPGPTLTAAAWTSGVYNNKDGTVTLTLTFDEVSYANDCTPTLTTNITDWDVTCLNAWGSATWACKTEAIAQSAETENLTIESATLVCAGGTISDAENFTAADLTVPGVTGTVVIRGVVDTDITHGGTSF